MIRLLIFDLDGTLVDTIEDITNAVNHAIKPFGVGPFPVERIRTMVGSGISRLISDLLPPHADREGAVQRFLEHYSTHLLDNTKPYPGVKETLMRLEDYKKAVISNKRERLSRDCLKGLGLLDYFDILLGSDSVSERKPSPVPVLEVLRRLGFSKDEALVIGDSNYDIESGHSAGVKVIAVTYGYRDREVLKEADFMIDRFSELIDILSRINPS
ncbi:MAG: HAD family hydrolase [Thermodesulfovibrionia bacterium]